MVDLTCVARGIGGVDDLRAHLDDAHVYFGVLRFTFGRGTFARDKFVFVHWNGSGCSVVKRGRANAQKQAVEVRNDVMRARSLVRALAMGTGRGCRTRDEMGDAFEKVTVLSKVTDPLVKLTRIFCIGGALAVAREHEFSRTRRVYGGSRGGGVVSRGGVGWRVR